MEALIQKNNKTYCKGNVVMLPTEYITNILEMGAKPIYIPSETTYVHGMSEGGNFKNLYITSDEEIKEGDYAFIGNFVTKQLTKEYLKKIKGLEYFKEYKKIIATTDKSLMLPVPESIAEYPFSHTPKNIPQIPQQFIEEYVKAGGIEKVLVELEVDTYGIKEVTLKPLLNQDNTVNIQLIEDKVYTRQEVVELCMLAHDNGWKANTTYTTEHGQNPKYTITNWINENL